MLKSGLKILVLIFGFVLLVGGVVSAQDTPSGKITYIFWENSASARSRVIARIEEFNKIYPDITVEPIGVPGTSWSDYLNGTATLVAGGQQTDIIHVATEGVRFLVGLDLIVPLNDLIAQDPAAVQEYMDDVAPALLDSMTVDDQLYFFPYSWNDNVIYYNKAMFDAAGLPYPQDGWTRDEFLTDAEALSADTNGDGNNDIYGYAGANASIFGSMPWVVSNGTNMVRQDFCAPNVTDPGVVEALQFIHDMIYTYEVSPAPGSVTSDFAQFANGELGMLGAGRWTSGQLYSIGFSDYDIVTWPGNPAVNTLFGVDGFGIFKSSTNQAAAWEFLKFMTGTPLQDILLKGPDGNPLGGIPARRSVADKMSEFPPEHYQTFYGALEGNFTPVPAPPRFNEMESIWMRYYNSIMADETTVEDAMTAAQNELMSVVTC